MSILQTMRQQDAVYWPRLARASDFGKPVYGTVLSLDVASGNGVRWVDEVRQRIGANGRQYTTKGHVYLGLLPDNTEVAVGGVLWLGNISGLQDKVFPFNNPKAYEIMEVKITPTFDATEFLREAFL